MDVFTAMSLFTGYDGIGLGLKRAIPNLRTICYVEREIFPVCNLVAKIKENKLDDAPVWDDIATFDGKPFAGMVDILHAGIPCQPWSVAGKQEGVEDERWLWEDVFRVIVEVRPNYIFIEEVPGFVRGGGLGFLLSDLAKAGYDAEWDCFTAAETGAPHKRERLFILAIASGAGTGCLGGKTDGQSRQQVLRQRNGQACTGGIAAATQLGKPQSQRCREAGRDCKRPTERATSTGTVADTDTGGSRQDRQQCELRTGSVGQPPCDTGNCPTCQEKQGRWPARPGQEQYEWEEPRTVEFGMGRTVDGFRSRVDELRLLGNGVVPAQAELAFRTLWEKL